jgi:hypothetical protein
MHKEAVQWPYDTENVVKAGYGMYTGENGPIAEEQRRKSTNGC